MSNLETDSHSYYSFYPLCIKYYGSHCWTFFYQGSLDRSSPNQQGPCIINFDLWKLWLMKINCDINVARLWQDGDSLVSGNVTRKDEKIENVSKIINGKLIKKILLTTIWSKRAYQRSNQGVKQGVKSR